MAAFKGSKMNPIAGRNPYRFGEIPGFPIGTRWPSRRELLDEGIHSSLSAGICGRGQEGAFAIVLSGGYQEDEDLGEEFTYTGHGGQAKRVSGSKWGKEQIKDQEWKLGNLALRTSHETKLPVRVIRGHTLKSPWAPAEGYQYDGLYTVEEATMKRGKSGFLVCVFKLKRFPGQIALPGRNALHKMRPERPAHLRSSPSQVQVHTDRPRNRPGSEELTSTSEDSEEVAQVQHTSLRASTFYSYGEESSAGPARSLRDGEEDWGEGSPGDDIFIKEENQEDDQSFGEGANEDIHNYEGDVVKPEELDVLSTWLPEDDLVMAVDYEELMNSIQSHGMQYCINCGQMFKNYLSLCPDMVGSFYIWASTKIILP